MGATNTYFEGHLPRNNRITNMRWSRSGRFLGIPNQTGSVIIFDIESQKITKKLGYHSDSVTAIAWARKDECILTGSRNGAVWMWEVSSGTRAPFVLRGHRNAVHTIEWTDDEAFVMTCADDRVRIFDGSCLHAGWSKETEDRFNRDGGYVAASCSAQSTFLLAVAACEGSLLYLVSLICGNILTSFRMSMLTVLLALLPVVMLVAWTNDTRV